MSVEVLVLMMIALESIEIVALQSEWIERRCAGWNSKVCWWTWTTFYGVNCIIVKSIRMQGWMRKCPESSVARSSQSLSISTPKSPTCPIFVLSTIDILQIQGSSFAFALQDSVDLVSKSA
jgi:hypothetical protein